LPPGLPAATPELDSFTLLGGGFASMGGYALLKLRSARKHRLDEGLDTEPEDDQA
jgi:hypothetical protein